MANVTQCVWFAIPKTVIPDVFPNRKNTETEPDNNLYRNQKIPIPV